MLKPVVTPEYYLYILVRTDMESMNPGRVAAQVSHATSDFHEYYHVQGYITETIYKQYWKQNQPTSFGTVIVLDGGSEKDLKDFMLVLESNYINYWGKTVDPEYVIRDGSVIHTIPNVLTCVWAFLPKDNAFTSNFPLYGG